MTSTFALITAYSLFGFNWTFIIAGMIRSRLVPGTRKRYIMATLQWTVVAPAMIFGMLSIVAGERVWGSINFLFTLWCLYDLYRNGDDNWWRRKRKQLKQRLAVRQLHLAGAKV